MITSPINHLDSDTRFRQWGKLIASPADIDLSQTNGYSLKGKWVKWSESVSLTLGRWLICASETGSAKYHSYKYALIDGDGNRIDNDNRVAALDSALEAGRITEDQRVKAKNSVLYSYALYISIQ
jgi:hypothetical protein